MQAPASPPFRLARGLAAGPAALAPACCQPAAAAPAAPARRRTRLAELDAHFHCSVIGTCLGTAELRRLVPRLAGLERGHASDVEIHHEAVRLAMAGGAGAKALQKALDERHAAAVRRFAACKDSAALAVQWRAALASGDIPSAYWALMTHPDATVALRQEAFGEVHMLSHLVGAANRADIRRLVELEAENGRLRAKAERQQLRLQDLGTRHRAVLERLAEAQARAPREDVHTPASAGEIGPGSDLDALREACAGREALALLHDSRREAAERRAAEAEAAANAGRRELAALRAELRASRAETEALEHALLAASLPDGTDAGQATLASLQGRSVLYVGGRPGARQALKTLVETAGGRFHAHDGGIEDRKGLLDGAVARADLVVFPVDCIDHDSMSRLKRLCAQHGIPYRPLRSAGVASFIEATARSGELPAARPRLAGTPAPAGDPPALPARLMA